MKAGTGRGSDVSAHGGISPYPGTGGAGSGTNGKPVVPGVSVRGGSNIVTLPSFGSDGDQGAGGGRSSSTDRHRSGITVVATSRSGGAFNFYGGPTGGCGVTGTPNNYGVDVLNANARSFINRANS